jgi:N-acetylglutamate synthase-like GNAT family acetyltransferase
MNSRFSGFGVSKSSESITAYWVGGEIKERGTASADATSKPEQWSVSRVLIEPPESRNKGIGGKLLEMLKQEVKDIGIKELIVCPGGYDADQVKQINFYEKHGFVKSTEDSELLVCTL